MMTNILKILAKWFTYSDETKPNGAGIAINNNK